MSVIHLEVVNGHNLIIFYFKYFTAAPYLETLRHFYHIFQSTVIDLYAFLEICKYTIHKNVLIKNNFPIGNNGICMTSRCQT